MPDYLSALAQQHWPAGMGTPAAWHWVLQTNGAYAAHNNLLLFGFPTSQRQPALVAKICRTPRHSHTLQTEYLRLCQLWQALGERAAGRAPRPLALAQHGADRALLMTHCPGDPLLAAPAHFWQNQSQVEKLLQQAAVWLRQLHQYATRPEESGMVDEASALEADFGRKAEAFAGIFPLPPAALEELRRLTRQVAQAQANAAGCTLLQGDFWPGNVLLPAAGGTAAAGSRQPAADDAWHTTSAAPAMALVDWQFSRWDRHTTLDVYLFIIVCAVKSTPYTPSYADRAQRAAQVLLAWRANLLPAYLAAYGQPAPCRLLPPRAGVLACCVELAVRPYLAFGVTQADASQWQTLFSEISRLWLPED